MFSHEPHDYKCPFCNFLKVGYDKYNEQQDIVYQNEFATAFISPKWWINNPGHVLVISNGHFENIYTIPEEQIAEVYKVVKKIAVAVRDTYDCDGTSTRQHNEPSGGQDVWHFHAHVFPRHVSDQLYLNDDNRSFVSPEARLPYAEKLRKYFTEHQ